MTAIIILIVAVVVAARVREIRAEMRVFESRHTNKRNGDYIGTGDWRQERQQPTISQRPASQKFRS